MTRWNIKWTLNYADMPVPRGSVADADLEAEVAGLVGFSLDRDGYATPIPVELWPSVTTERGQVRMIERTDTGEIIGVCRSSEF